MPAARRREAECRGASQVLAHTSAKTWDGPHRSNYIYFVVNLRNAQYAQKCHDPDCAHFRSEWMPLPRALVLQSQAVMSPGSALHLTSGERRADTAKHLVAVIDAHEREVVGRSRM